MKRSSSVKHALVLLTFLVYGVYPKLVAKDLSSQAEAYFQAGQFAEAKDAWNQLLTAGEQSAQLHYNIGLAESAQGNVPQAILSYEKALRLKPYDSEIREALRRERMKIPDAVIPIKPFILIDWVGRMISFFRPGTWAFFGLCSLIIAVGCWFQAMKKEAKSKSIRSIYIFTIILGAVMLGMACLSYDRIYQTEDAIIMNACELKQAPSEESTLIRVVHPGEKISIEDEIGSWSKVRLLNLDDGWMQNQCLEVISLKSFPGN